MVANWSRPRTYQYVEGGGDNPPFGEDPFQRILKVHWAAGGLFFTVTAENQVSSDYLDGDIDPVAYASKGGKNWSDAIVLSGVLAPNTQWINVRGGVGGIVGKKNIYILGGDYGYDPVGDSQFFNRHEFLFYSDDCVHWTRINLPYDYSDPPEDTAFGTGVETAILRVMFLPHTQTFYLDGWRGGHFWSRDMWMSTDGKNWTKEFSRVFWEVGVGTGSSFVSDFIPLALANRYDNGYTGAINHATGTRIYFENAIINLSTLGGSLVVNGPLLRNDVVADISFYDAEFGLCFANGSFLASGRDLVKGTNTASLSTDDGVTWSRTLDLPPVKGSYRISGLFCGANTAPADAVVEVGGGIFANGGSDGYVRYARTETKNNYQIWEILLASEVGASVREVFCSSYANINGTPTFLLGGNNNYGQSDGWSGLILLSNDGRNWTTVLTVWEQFSNNADVVNLVWDVNEGAFYADVDVHASTVSDNGYRLYRSPDGHTWTRINIGTPPVFSEAVFKSHCNGKIPGVEDGYYGYDAVHDVLIQPWSSNNVLVSIAGVDEIIDTGLGFVYAVAYAGGIWIAVGGNTSSDYPALASSTDNGKTWVQVPIPVPSTSLSGDVIVTVIGAPITDFPPS